MRSAKTLRRSTRRASRPRRASIEWRSMVDLVKIRKKAKKAEVAGSQLPVAEQPAVEPATDNRQPATSPATPAESKLEKFKDEAGHRREGLVVETRENIAENVVELLTFVIAAENYAVHIENIVEIVTPRPVTRIP